MSDGTQVTTNIGAYVEACKSWRIRALRATGHSKSPGANLILYFIQQASSIHRLLSIVSPHSTRHAKLYIDLSFIPNWLRTNTIHKKITSHYCVAVGRERQVIGGKLDSQAQYVSTKMQFSVTKMH